MDEYMEILPDTWQPEKEGDFIKGLLVSKEEKIGKHESNLYTIETESHKLLSVWGSTVLDMRMKLIDIGTYVWIEYKGKQPSKKGKDVKIFKVAVKKNV